MSQPRAVPTLKRGRPAARRGDIHAVTSPELRQAPRASGAERVRGGTYYDVSLVLEPADSGIEIDVAPGETPVLYGGRRLLRQNAGQEGVERFRAEVVTPGLERFAPLRPQVAQVGRW